MKLHGKHLSRKANAKYRLSQGYDVNVVYPKRIFDSSPQSKGYYQAIHQPISIDLLTQILSILTLSKFWKARMKKPDEDLNYQKVK